MGKGKGAQKILGFFLSGGEKVGFKHSVTLRSAALDWREDGWRQSKRKKKGTNVTLG